MKKQYTKKQIAEAIAYWQKQLNESKLDLDDDIDMENAHSTAHIDQNLRDFVSVFFENDVTVKNPSIDYVARALEKSVDVAKLKDFISRMKSLGITHKSFKKVVSSLESLVYLIKTMEEFDSKTSLDGFEDDVY